MIIRASLEVSLGRTKSLGGLDVLAGSGLMVDGVGSGVGSLAFEAGFERVRAMVVSVFGRLGCRVM